LALFRHFNPAFRVLVIAPRFNIQDKWMRETRKFVAHMVRFPDLRVKGLDDKPNVPLVMCDNLLSLVHETSLDSHRDFFARLTSFSLPLGGKNDEVDLGEARRLRNGLKPYLRWMEDEVFDLRQKQAFKDNFARALCCALPKFDLVVVDEGHNLKHGFREDSSSRNRTLAIAMGHPRSNSDARLFRNFGPRAARVLFLSATPVEDSYTHLWNQLDIFGMAGPYERLCQNNVDDEEKKKIASQFLVRRVTLLHLGDQKYSKNQYRREWRNGGVFTHDEPIRTTDPKQRLVVALIQKKVSELLGHEKFHSSFQIGMLASFESFLQTSNTRISEKRDGTFDDTEQTKIIEEKKGIDVRDVNNISRSYRSRFGEELPHPKMDALVESLSHSWRSGTKSLVFVRRIASVWELKRKLDEKYDEWLIQKLKKELPTEVQPLLQVQIDKYREVRKANLNKSVENNSEVQKENEKDQIDQGGNDTFFAWFFRGEGPKEVISGATVQQRFGKGSGSYSTFFENNYVSDLLDCEPGQVQEALLRFLGIDENVFKVELRERARKFLPRAEKLNRGNLFEAAQAAAIEWIMDRSGPHQERAKIIWRKKYSVFVRMEPRLQSPDLTRWLELPTFFTELRKNEVIRDRIWPLRQCVDANRLFLEQEIRAQLLASTARLGHSLIDLYVLTIRRLGSIAGRTREKVDENVDREQERIDNFINLLVSQMNTPREERDWGAYDELSEIAKNFDLIMDVNQDDIFDKSLDETSRIFGGWLRSQQPVGGMWGKVSPVLVKQFRMPGYPFVMVSTDLLQEGEDLHTFCSSVYHYGIAWTPSSMEQRIGRIDRVRSLTERKLTELSEIPPKRENLLQVYYPYLDDTVEVLQVQRVLERMNTFLKLMHEGLILSGPKERSVDTQIEFLRGNRQIPQVHETLKSAFPAQPHFSEISCTLTVNEDVANSILKRFADLVDTSLPGISIIWDRLFSPVALLGTAKLKSRIQPFILQLRSLDGRILIRCVSPVGRVGPRDDQEKLIRSVQKSRAKLGAIETDEERTFDLTVEDDILLTGKDDIDRERLAALISRTVDRADLLEQIHLPGHDESLELFRPDLENEVRYGI
jgi:hypothetical protein